jgi:hypothetical protein
MDDARLISAHDASSLHRSAVERSARCGCFYCLHVFSPDAIVEWTDDDQTAICPHCGIDSVLPEAAGFPIDKEFLSAMQAHWF